jgi:hypothetical protein
MASVSEARASKCRFALGMLQIAGVGMSLGIMSRQGLTALAMAFIVGTTLIAVISALLFRSEDGRQERRRLG